MYADGQNANVQVQATGHTDPKLKFDPAAPTPSLDARVYLAEDEQLFGKLEAIGADSLDPDDHLGRPHRRPAGPRPRGVHGDGRPQGVARVVRQAPQGPGERGPAPGPREGRRGRGDRGRRRGGEGEQAHVRATRARAGRLALKQVEGLVLAARPAPQPPTEVRPTFTLSGGLVLSGRWDKIDGDKWQVETPWGQTVKLPAAEIRGVRFRGGQMAYLSDLEAEQGRGDPVLRPPDSLSPGRRARRLAAEARRPAHREGARGPLADGPDLRPRPPIRHVRGPGRIRRLGQQEGPRRLPGLRRRQGALRQSRPPRRRPAGPPVPARLGGRTAPARRGLRARRGHRAIA